MSSPENLGKVVDIQLREQILMYDNLLSQYNQIQEEKSKLNEQIAEHIQKTNVLESRCHQIEEENKCNVKRYEDKLDELAALSKESETNLQEFQLLRIEFDSLMSKVNESHRRIEDLTGAKSLLEHQLSVSEKQVNDLKEINATISTENATHRLHIERFKVSENKLQLELKDNSDLINRLQTSIQQLEDKIDRLTKLLDDLQSQNDRLKEDKQKSSEEYAVSLNAKEIELAKMEQDRNERIAELEHQVKLVR